jgi:hypothetical protein
MDPKGSIVSVEAYLVLNDTQYLNDVFVKAVTFLIIKLGNRYS